MDAVREQKEIADGIDDTKRTERSETNEGFVELEATTLEAPQQQQPSSPVIPAVIASQPEPQPSATHTVTISGPPEPRCCDYVCCCDCSCCWDFECYDYGCCECDNDFNWYSCHGKGAGIVILLILLYLVPIFVIGLVLFCICVGGCGCRFTVGYF